MRTEKQQVPIIHIIEIKLKLRCGGVASGYYIEINFKKKMIS